jgi:Protein of unknown function, DUF547
MVTAQEPQSTLRPIGVLSLLALLWALVCPSPALAAPFDHNHAALTSILAQHVRWNEAGTATTVDYAALRRDRAALDAYTRALSSVGAAEFSGWNTRQRRSFLINAYNAFTLQLILTRYPELTSIRDLGNIVFNSPWKQRFFFLLGATRHLDEVEHEMLRGAADFDEPRIHFAVNCASIGCPALRPEAYRADRLDAQLEDQTRRFLRDRSRNRLELNGEPVVRISPIFKWYRKDFEADHHGWTTLQQFLAAYADALGDSAAGRAALREAAFSVQYTDYSWRLNDR